MLGVGCRKASSLKMHSNFYKSPLPSLSDSLRIYRTSEHLFCSHNKHDMPRFSHVYPSHAAWSESPSIVIVLLSLLEALAFSGYIHTFAFVISYSPWDERRDFLFNLMKGINKRISTYIHTYVHTHKHSHIHTQINTQQVRKKIQSLSIVVIIGFSL